MYTPICAEAGMVRAIANSTPHIQFNFILVSPVCLDLGCEILLASCRPQPPLFTSWYWYPPPPWSPGIIELAGIFCFGL